MGTHTQRSCLRPATFLPGPAAENQNQPSGKPAPDPKSPAKCCSFRNLAVPGIPECATEGGHPHTLRPESRDRNRLNLPTPSPVVRIVTVESGIPSDVLSSASPRILGRTHCAPAMEPLPPARFSG